MCNKVVRSAKNREDGMHSKSPGQEENSPSLQVVQQENPQHEEGTLPSVKGGRAAPGFRYQRTIDRRNQIMCDILF